MASTDALPLPRKNTAYRVYFDGRKNDGTLITSGTGMDSEVSKDGGTFTDCTSEATEIATTSGVYYLDLSSTEMNADSVVVKVTWTNANALPQVITLYPTEDTDIRSFVVSMNTDVITDASIAADAIDNAALISDIADGVFDEAKSGHTATGTFGEGVSGIISGTATTGTLSTTQMSASALPSTHDDQYNGRRIVWTSGALVGLATTITDYTNTGRVLTFVTVHTAPTNGDTFVIV